MNHVLWYPGHDILLDHVTRAENCSLFTADGSRWVDMAAGVWCTSIGHGHPRAVRVMTDQAARLAHAGFGYSSLLVEEAAEEVLAALGLDGGRCVFLCSGSEAVEYGVRVAQAVLDGPLLVTMHDSYCGAYGSANAKCDTEWFCLDWSGCRDCTVEGGCTGDCATWATIPFDRIGGFLLEPGSSSGLVRFPPTKLVRTIAEQVRARDGLVLANEVTTGIGRTGTWFGFEHYELAPDIVALGKGVGNGYPVSVAAISARVADRLGGAPIAYAQSHQNDPLGAVVAREVLRTIRDEGLIQRGREIADLLLAGLEDVARQTGRIAELRARGLMVAIELADEGQDDLAGRVQRALFERGFVVPRRPGLPVLRLDPALTIERTDVEAFVAALGGILDHV